MVTAHVSAAFPLYVLDDFAHVVGKFRELSSAVGDRRGGLELPRLQPRGVLGYRASTEGCALARRNAASNPDFPERQIGVVQPERVGNHLNGASIDRLVGVRQNDCDHSQADHHHDKHERNMSQLGSREEALHAF